jgi:Helix-turn-helix domain
MSMNAPEKVARQRLRVLQLAQGLGSVSEACRQRGMTRTQFYDYKRRFELQGLEGLKDLPPIHKTHPQTTPETVVAQILALSLAHPAWGCVRLSAHLKLASISVSSPTIQDILIRAGMGRTFERLLQLEEQVAADGLALTPEQTQAVEKGNPCFRERQVESSRPGELLAADTYSVGTFNGIGTVYVHTVVDTYGSLALASCTPANCPPPQSPYCTTRSCPCTPSGGCRSAPSSPTRDASSAGPLRTPMSALSPSLTSSTAAPRSNTPTPLVSSSASS